MSVIRVAPIESMARRALVKNLKNHNGNSLWAINNVPCLLSAAPPGTGSFPATWSLSVHPVVRLRMQEPRLR
jgi:hypothetical protein